MRFWRTLLIGILLAAASPLAALPDSLAEQGESRAPQAAPPAEPSRLKVGLEMRWRWEGRDNADQQPADDLERFLGQRVRLSVRLQAHPHLGFFVQGQDVWLWGAERDQIIHDLATNLHQAYLDWKPGGSPSWELRAGRQEFLYGEERLLGPVGWDNVGRSFDAVRLRYQAGAWSSDLFGGRHVDVRRSGVRGRPADQDLYGFHLARAPAKSSGRTEFYGLLLRDGLRVRGESPNNPAETVRLATFGVRRAYQPQVGWRYTVEHAWQLGRRGPDPHRATMLVAKGGYAWAGRLQPRLILEYDLASGDDAPRDGDSREFHNLFPTNHLYYGYADLLGLRNLHGLRLTAAARPHPKLTVEADYHRFLLAARRGSWKNAGGRVLGFDPSGQSGRDIGQEVDLTFRIPLSSHLNLLAGYSVFLPGGFAIRTRGPEPHHFGYLQSTVSF